MIFFIFLKDETSSLDFRDFSFEASSLFVIRRFSKEQKTEKSQPCMRQ